MKLQKIPKYSSTKIPKYPNIKVLKDEIIKRSPSCSFARGELEKMIKRPKHPSPPYHLYPSKTFLGQLKWTESTRIHDTSYRPLDQPRNQIQRLDIDQDQDNGQSKDKTGTNRNSMIRSAIIKRLLGGSFPFSSVWKLLYCARFCKLLYFARDPSVQSHFLNCGLRPLFADVSVRLRWGKNRPPPNVPTCPLTPRHNSQLTTSTWALSHANMLVASLMCRGFLLAEISGFCFYPTEYHATHCVLKMWRYTL